MILSSKLNGGSDISGGISYSKIIYNNDNTITLTDKDGKKHTMVCEYADDEKLVGVTYDGKEVAINYEDDKLNVGDTAIDLSGLFPSPPPVRTEMEVYEGGTVPEAKLLDTSGLGTLYKLNEGKAILVRSSNSMYFYLVSEIKEATYYSKWQTVNNLEYDGKTYYYCGWKALGGTLSNPHPKAYVYDGSTVAEDMVVAVLDYYFSKT